MLFLLQFLFLSVCLLVCLGVLLVFFFFFLLFFFFFFFCLVGRGGGGVESVLTRIGPNNPHHCQTQADRFVSPSFHVVIPLKFT